MHYYKSNNEIMQYCIVSNDIALIMHYRALLKRSDHNNVICKLNKHTIVVCMYQAIKGISIWLVDIYIFLSAIS